MPDLFGGPVKDELEGLPQRKNPLCSQGTGLGRKQRERIRKMAVGMRRGQSQKISKMEKRESYCCPGVKKRVGQEGS